MVKNVKTTRVGGVAKPPASRRAAAAAGGETVWIHDEGSFEKIELFSKTPGGVWGVLGGLLGVWGAFLGVWGGSWRGLVARSPSSERQDVFSHRPESCHGQFRQGQGQFRQGQAWKNPVRLEKIRVEVESGRRGKTTWLSIVEPLERKTAVFVSM